MKRIIVLLFFLGSQLNSFAQIDIDNLSNNIKLWFVPELNQRLLDKYHLESFFDQPLDIEEIYSEGFEDLIFYKIPDQVLSSVKKSNGNIEQLVTPIPKDFGQYIIAYSLSQNRLFRITGFEYSEFYQIVENRAFFTRDTGGRRCTQIKSLNKYCAIEGLDLKQLIKEKID